MNENLEGLRPFATSKGQKEILDALIECNGVRRRAAIMLGIEPHHVRRAIKLLKGRQAAASPATDDMDKRIYPDYGMGKMTVQRGPGGVERVWERQSPEDRAEHFKVAIEQFFNASYQKFDAPQPPKGDIDSDIIPWIQIGDAHLGMVAWAREVGHNFDLNIGMRELFQAFKNLVDRAPATERIVINDLGDFTHYENFAAETEMSRNKLDVDGRFPKMAEVVAVLWRLMIDYALTKYQFVDVIPNQGNHSRTNDIWVKIMIEWAYKDTGRVNVLQNEGVFIPYRMGNTFVVTHHSDKASGTKLADVVINDYRDHVRECEHVYVDTGHIHHKKIANEYGVVLIESYNNLAPNDAWHHSAGWRSKQSMCCVVRHKKYGRIETYIEPVQKVWDSLQKVFGEDVQTSMPKRDVFTV